MSFFAIYEYLRGNLRVRLAAQRKSLRKFNLHPLATTCRSVWPRLYSSFLSYCRIVWGSSWYDHNVKPLQRKQKKAIRLITFFILF